MNRLNVCAAAWPCLFRNARSPFVARSISYVTNSLTVRRRLPARFPVMQAATRRPFTSARAATESRENEEDEADDARAEEAAAEAADATTPEDLRTENERMKQAKLKELEAKYKLSLSNCDNMCKIHKKELENTKVYAVSEFAKGLLEVADTFELAFRHLENAEARESPDDFVDGMRMTESLLHQTFEKFGIKKYESLNAEFDPQVHEAMFEVKDEESHNRVLQVVKNGYTISGRVLRPAKVGVSKKLNL